MRGLATVVLAAAAVLWGCVLLVGAERYPAYTGTRTSIACPGCPEVRTIESTRTLVEVNGPQVLGVMSVPLVVALGTSMALWWRSRRGGESATVIAWTLVGLLAVLTFLAMFSVGTFFLPSVALLAAATSVGPRARASEAGPEG